MIPVEAVEAAARAIYHPLPLYDEAKEEITGHRPWEWLTPEYQESLRRDARAALEAAAPHMHRIVTTIAELDTLPAGTVILEGNGSATQAVMHKPGQTLWRDNNYRALSSSDLITLPAKVLSEATK